MTLGNDGLPPAGQEEIGDDNRGSPLSLPAVYYCGQYLELNQETLSPPVDKKRYHEHLSTDDDTPKRVKV